MTGDEATLDYRINLFSAKCVIAKMVEESTPQIKAVEEKSLDALLSLYRFLHPDDKERPSTEEAKRILREMQDDPRTILMGMFLGNHLIAACNAAIVLNLTRGGRPFAVIENVVTRPDFQGKGYGTLLMKSIIDECWKRGCYKILLMSNSRRGDAHRFYRSLGFDMDAKKAFVMYR